LNTGFVGLGFTAFTADLADVAVVGRRRFGVDLPLRVLTRVFFTVLWSLAPVPPDWLLLADDFDADLLVTGVLLRRPLIE
jgi:hypothetical protein